MYLLFHTKMGSLDKVLKHQQQFVSRLVATFFIKSISIKNNFTYNQLQYNWRKSLPFIRDRTPCLFLGLGGLTTNKPELWYSVFNFISASL